MKRTLVCLLMLAAVTAYGQGLVRTGDMAKRGYKESDFPRVKKLADNIYSYEALRGGDPDGKMTTVSLFVVTSEGVLVADGQGNPAQTQRMIDDIKKVTNQPIRYVVVCSDHGDHTGGNQVFPSTAVFIAHPTSVKTLQASAAAPTRRPDAPKVIIPTESVADKRVLKMGGTEIQILFLGRAHTGGDLSVYLPKEKVLFMSEAYLNRIFPAMRSAFPSEWVETVKKAEKMGVNVYVPGHGFVEDPKVLKEELVAYRRALETVIAEVKKQHAAGKTAEQADKDANFGEYQNWTLHGGQRRTAINKVFDELTGKLAPKP